jgi:predicted permease
MTMLLGIGEAGHIGLNEPLSAPMSRTQSVLVVQAAMPVAIFPIVVTRAHHGDMPTALQVVLGTSAMGLIAIPLWIGLGMHWTLPGP